MVGRPPGIHTKNHRPKRESYVLRDFSVRNRSIAHILEPDEIRKRGYVQNAADEFALERGIWDDEREEYFPCRFCEYRAEHIVNVFKKHFRLWEGRHCGQDADPDRLNWAGNDLRNIFGWVYFDDNPAINRWVRRFRTVAIWIGKKNGKSPTAAGVGLYLLKWDGEQGQNVFSAARDNKQAALVHRHARVMVGSMPKDQADQFGINNTTGEIRYPRTNSIYSTLSGENYRSQEGKNGSVIIDEIHVVDDRLIQCLEGIDAGRDEPLKFQISTAGNDPEGYGRKEYDYGKLIESGQPGIERKDTGYYFKSYECPQDTVDEKLIPQPDGKISRETLDLLRLANPAWGVTVQSKEICDKLRRARRSGTDWVNFKQRRAMIWQQSANPWFILDQNAFADCGKPFEIEEIEGAGGSVGLDLSRTMDFTAAVYTIYDGEKWRQFSRFWVPQARYESLIDRIPLRDWHQNGHISVHTGGHILFSQIEDDLCSDMEKIGTRLVVYDPTFAEDLIQRMEDRVSIDLEPFKQGFESYAGPTEDYERVVYARELEHSGNPVLNWMVDNVHIAESQGRRRPMKERKDSYKVIDGAQAAIMSLYGAMKLHTIGESAYEERGILVI